ncbi:MAG: DNA-directed RNA polymerase subunit D [Methanobacteriota archaeon]
MKIEKIKIDEHGARAVLSDVTPSFMNALRRALMAEVPKMAISDVEFHLGAISDEEGKAFESTAPLFDEMIAHRLSLVPIPTDLSLFTFRSECSCKGEGCPTCTIMYSLNKKGPAVVYSGDLEPLGDDKFRVKDPLIPLTKLADGEALLIYGTATLGRGREHAKWQATQAVGYNYYPSIAISKKCDGCGDCIKRCPREVLAKKDGKAVVEKLEDCTLCKTCVEVCPQKAVTLSEDSTKVIFKFETDGSVPPKDALLFALKYLEDAFGTLRDAVGDMEDAA